MIADFVCFMIPAKEKEEDEPSNEPFYRNSLSYTCYNDPVLPENEVVLLWGPPFSGKTKYFQDRFNHSSYKRISTKDFPNESLHSIILKMIKILLEGESIVFDDENRKTETRKSIIDGVRKKLPTCRFRAVCFWPVGGLGQCLWAREFAIVEKEDFGQLATFSEVCEWFAMVRRVPKRHEGFERITNVKTNLYCRSLLQMNKPALLIDVCSMLKFVPLAEFDYAVCAAKMRYDNVKETLEEWRLENREGVVVFCCSESLVFPASLQLYFDDALTYLELQQRYKQDMLDLIRSCIPSKCHAVIVAHSYCCEEKSFWNPPNPGMIACAQKLAGLDLRKSVVVCDENGSFCSMVRDVGLNYVRSEKFWNKAHNGWNANAKIRKFMVKAPLDEKEENWEFLHHLVVIDEAINTQEQRNMAEHYWEILKGTENEDNDEKDENREVIEEDIDIARRLPLWMEEEKEQDEEQDEGIPVNADKENGEEDEVRIKNENERNWESESKRTKISISSESNKL